ncbi:MAG TPA: hypothetical protein VNL74_05375 [Methylococcus sp.]|nr:hypothetical protein [Methylococcus sp.]
MNKQRLLDEAGLLPYIARAFHPGSSNCFAPHPDNEALGTTPAGEC